MWEGVLIGTGLELSKQVLKQVLDLGQSALEGYVEDFFKDCFDSGVARLQASSLKGPMAEAIGCFIQRFVEELQINEIPETSLDHYYKAAIKQFVRDKAVGQILGKAFETDCKQIDYQQLEQLWLQRVKPGWQFPVEEFDWRRVAKSYVLAVKGIVKADAELRALLDTELLETIAQNTAQLSPGFDVIKYRQSLQASYGHLKLYILDSTDRVDAIKLWNIFIEQTVREALPPMRYDLPLDVKRKLQAEGQLESDLSPEALEYYQREYLQQPARKALEAIADSQQSVILGDPGAGKSTLLQYLALNWVEGKAETLPLLIELREYVLAESTSFLDFLHRGRGADWQFDQQRLHEYLLEQPTLVMFDGLDEVFDRATQAAVVDDIIRFAQRYPQAQILVTSRIIGYNPERFQHAGFRQFTIQALDEFEMHQFIDRWYDLAMGNDPDKMRLKQRLRDAIANSKAIENLADNPLLLTMMAILNRRQELPRDRADLYDQASRVLLYHWDVDHKRLNLPLDAIGRREKQEILRAIAYEMQAGEDGLKGNLISADRLTQILTTYLREQGFDAPREKANRLIQQLRERNFILCYRGADTYGFMHRTFLEYFCAVEIVNRFEKQRSLTFEQLRDEVFGQHWQDEAWHEVLRLICGMIDSKLAGILVEYLISQRVDRKTFLSQEPWGHERLQVAALANLLLAADCVADISHAVAISSIRISLLEHLKQEVEVWETRLSWDLCEELLNRIASYFDGTLLWLKQQVEKNKSSFIQYAAVKAIAKYYHHESVVESWFKHWAKYAEDWGGQAAAVEVIGKHYYGYPDTFPLLQELIYEAGDWGVRNIAVEAIASHYYDYSITPKLLIDVIKFDAFRRIHPEQSNPRKSALNGLLEYYSDLSETIELLSDRAANDPDEQLRSWAQKKLESLEAKTRNTEV
ncbi:NACHT domain-containing protein [Sphaerothrix gracilis]|uniref:NACHT domain-containing protein n=1 Tax=Sphaerothrix gracilis TaxID=3151835 RepID=UPI0031FD2F85